MPKKKKKDVIFLGPSKIVQPEPGSYMIEAEEKIHKEFEEAYKKQQEEQKYESWPKRRARLLKEAQERARERGEI